MRKPTREDYINEIKKNDLGYEQAVSYLESHNQEELTTEEYEDLYGICTCSDIRKNRGYRYSRADNLSRNQIILLADIQMGKSPEFINDVLKFKGLEPMKTIDIVKSYELKEVKELELGDKFEVKLEEPYGIQTAHVVNVDRLGGIVAQTFRKTPLYLKEGYVIRELGTEQYKLLSNDEAKELLK